MYAIEVTEFGGPENMRWTEAPDPRPGAGQVLIDVRAAGVNRADLLQRRGLYPPPEGVSETLGLECSGVVAEVGTGVSTWKIGDEVCALLAGGGYAQRVVVPQEQVLPVPDGVDLVTAAGLPEIAATVLSNLVLTAGLHAGQLILIHGGGSGIGTHAIQIARQLGARVAVTAGSPEKLARCAQFGAEILINYRERDFVAEITKHTGQGGPGPDVILDIMGAAYLERNIAAVAPGGLIVVIGMQGGSRAEMDLSVLLRKRAAVRATNVRYRPVTGPGSKAEIISEVRERVWPMVSRGEIVPVTHAVLPIEKAADAHRLLDAPDTVGKVILQVR